MLPEGGHPGQELTVPGTDRTQIDAPAARQLRAKPSDRFFLVKWINRRASQFNGVGAIAIANLKQGTGADLKHFRSADGCGKQQQTETDQECTDH